MQSIRGLGLAVCLVISQAYADVDVAALKKTLTADFEALAKKMHEEVQQASDEFRIRDAQAPLITSSYDREQHESFRSAEEQRLSERVSEAGKKIASEIETIVENAFVDVLKRQNALSDLVKQDLVVFKTKFAEGMSKMLQGKRPTPITYSSEEAVAKEVEAPKPVVEELAGPVLDKDVKPSPLEAPVHIEPAVNKPRLEAPSMASPVQPLPKPLDAPVIVSKPAVPLAPAAPAVLAKVPKKASPEQKDPQKGSAKSSFAAGLNKLARSKK